MNLESIQGEIRKTGLEIQGKPRDEGKDVREDLGTPNLPFVIADTGQLGEKTCGDMAKLCEIQLSFGDPAKHREFAGTVASVGTRGSARSVGQSPSSFDYHSNHNGESHYLIGEAMGKAMLELLKSKSAGKGELR